MNKTLDTQNTSRIISQQLSNSATQQLSNSATQQLSNSATQNDNALLNKLANLKDNPVFQMSLSAKELFHSNLLAMFLMLKDANDISLFPHLKNLFAPKNQEQYEILGVLREKEHFDLIIIYARKSELEKSELDSLNFNDIEDYLSKENTETDEKIKSLLKDLHYVVIENKFKSIPDKKQLAEYSDKINWKGKNTEGIKIFSDKNAARLCSENTTCYLFAPKKSLEVFFDGKKKLPECPDWKGISYEEYLEILRNSSKSLSQNQENSFLKELVEKYCDFVETMLDIYNEEILEKRFENGKAFLSSEQEKEFKKLRIQDFYEKLACSYLRNKLVKDLKLENYNKNENKKYEKFISQNSYSLGQGYVEFLFNWKNCFTTYLGLQNGELRIYIMSEKSGLDDDEAKNFIETIARKANEIEKLEFKKPTKKNPKELPYTYKTENYIVKYGKIPLSEYAEKKDADWREIPYKTLKEKVKIYLEKISEIEPEEFFRKS